MPSDSQPGVLVAGHYVESDDYQVVRPDGTRDYLMTFTRSGRGVFTIDGTGRDCREGDLTLLHPNIRHDYRTAEGQVWDFMWIHFVPDPHWQPLLRLPPQEHGFVCTHLANDARRRRIDQLMRWIIQDSRSLAGHGAELAMNALHAVLLLLHELEEPRRNRLDPRVEDVIHLMTRRMHEPLTIDELSRSVALSPSRLSHLYKAETGESLVSTLTKMRMREASRLLDFSSRTITEIAYDVGYANYAVFLKHFRAAFGMSPTSYRKRSARE